LVAWLLTGMASTRSATSLIGNDDSTLMIRHENIFDPDRFLRKSLD
jgi:hypothetical protein